MTENGETMNTVTTLEFIGRCHVLRYGLEQCAEQAEGLAGEVKSEEGLDAICHLQEVRAVCTERLIPALSALAQNDHTLVGLKAHREIRRPPAEQRVPSESTTTSVYLRDLARDIMTPLSLEDAPTVADGPEEPVPGTRRTTLCAHCGQAAYGGNRYCESCMAFGMRFAAAFPR